MGQVQIPMADLERATGMKRRAVMYALGRLAEASLITRRQSRGASYYGISGVIPTWPVRVAGGSDSEPETVHDNPGPGRTQRSVQGEINQESGPGPGSECTVNTEQPSPCQICGEGSMARSHRLARLGVEGAWYCRGQANRCPRVWDHVAGEVIPPDATRDVDMVQIAQWVRQARSEVWAKEKRAAAIVTAAPAPTPQPRPCDPSHPGYAPGHPDPAATWKDVQAKLEWMLPAAPFATYVRPCVGVGWQDGALVVETGSAFAVAWLERPLHRSMAHEATRDITGQEGGVIYRTHTLGGD